MFMVGLLAAVVRKLWLIILKKLLICSVAVCYMRLVGDDRIGCDGIHRSGLVVFIPALMLLF